MEKKSKEEELNWKKNNISQIEIEGWNWNQIKISQRVKKKNLEIKIIRIEIEILINKRTTLKFSMANVNFKGGEKKEKKKKKAWPETHRATTDHTRRPKKRRMSQCLQWHCKKAFLFAERHYTGHPKSSNTSHTPIVFWFLIIFYIYLNTKFPFS